MERVRTPDDRFRELPGWPWESRYLEVASGDGDTLRVAYVDEGPSDAPPVLLLHGEPTWGYLWRKLLPGLLARGHRVLVPDQIGFGRSDKPVQQADYTYRRHVGWMGELVGRLDVRRATFVGQDWGGMVGLGVVARAPERFDRIVIANSALPRTFRPATGAFAAWQERSQQAAVFPFGQLLLDTGCTITAEEKGAYDAPFPDHRFEAGARRFPMLAPSSDDTDDAAAMLETWQVLERWEKPFLTAFGDRDPVTGGFDAVYHRHVPGCAAQEHLTLAGAGHFLQEQVADELVVALDRLVALAPAD